MNAVMLYCPRCRSELVQDSHGYYHCAKEKHLMICTACGVQIIVEFRKGRLMIECPICGVLYEGK